MSEFGFGTLALLVVVGLAGPLLARVPRLGIPVVIGELVAGIVIGRTGFDLIDPADPTFELLANIGFALVMFVVGTHVPVRDATLRTAIPKALLRAALVGAVAAVLGVALARAFGTGHPLLYAVLMASSSAALALPVIDSLGLSGPPVLSTTAQIAIADTASIVLLPLAIDPAHAPRAALGALAIAACAAVLFVVLRYFERSGKRKRLHHYSEDHEQALELRISLILLFGLAPWRWPPTCRSCWRDSRWASWWPPSANRGGWPDSCSASPRASSAPLFFVWLGASLHVRESGSARGSSSSASALGVGAVLAHCVGRLMGQPLALAALRRRSWAFPWRPPPSAPRSSCCPGKRRR